MNYKITYSAILTPRLCVIPLLSCLSRSCICWLRWLPKARRVVLLRQSTQAKRKSKLLTSMTAFRMWSGISFYPFFILFEELNTVELCGSYIRRLFMYLYVTKPLFSFWGCNFYWIVLYIIHFFVQLVELLCCLRFDISSCVLLVWSRGTMLLRWGPNLNGIIATFLLCTKRWAKPVQLMSSSY